MEKELRDKIVNHQLHNVDKFYRMFAGLSSMLDDYENETIYLTIHKNSKWPKDNLVTAKQLANSWRNFNIELKNAAKYQVTIIHQETPTGFAINLAQLSDPSDVTAIAEAFKAATQSAEKKVQSPGVVVSGYFDSDLSKSNEIGDKDTKLDLVTKFEKDRSRDN
jgi:hypothetical protein